MRLKELQNNGERVENLEKYRVLDEDNYLIAGVSNGEPSIMSTQTQCHKYWDWDNSLRSNCDHFLETLEYHIDADQYMKRKS